MGLCTDFNSGKIRLNLDFGVATNLDSVEIAAFLCETCGAEQGEQREEKYSVRIHIENIVIISERLHFSKQIMNII